jgi:ABC-2 type transport system permease protein
LTPGIRPPHLPEGFPVFVTIASFEIRQRLRQLSTWVYFALFLGLSFLFFVAAAGAFRDISVGFGTGGKVMVNSPFTLATLISTVSYFAFLVTAALAGQAIHQDFQHGTYPLLFSAPIRKSAYLGGRFVGILLVLTLIQASAGLGCWLGSLMPFVDAKLIGPNRALGYLGPYLLLVLPNLLILAPLFFSIAALTRKMRAVYVSAVLLFVGYLLAATLSSKLENKTWASLLDPFGSYAFEHLTEYWTPAEKNSRLVPLAGLLLVNRLLWLVVGAGALSFTFARFRFAEPLPAGRSAGARPTAEAAALAPPAVDVLGSPQAHPAPSPLARSPALAGLVWLSFRETVKSLYFLLIALAGVLFVVVTARTTGLIYGTETYPVTRAMIELASGSFGAFTLIIVIIYSGELVWREREARIDQIIDAAPVTSWRLYAAKLGALLLVGVLLHLLVMACGLGIQIARGYYRFELPLYLFDLLGLRLVGYFQLAALALFVQVLVNHKHLGQFVMVLYFLSTIVLPIAGFEHNLYIYGGDPGYVYSDMNGYGHFLGPWGWFNLYWSLFALILVVLSSLLWVRGQDTRLRHRLRLAVARSAGAPRVALVVLSLGFIGTGAFIFWNTNVLNEYTTAASQKRERYDYERLYKRHEREPQPRVTDVRVHFDIHPETRALRTRGTYRIENKTAAPIPIVYLNLPSDVKIHALSLGELTRPTGADHRLDFYTFAMRRPLAPGAEAELAFDLEYRPVGFKNRGAGGVVMGNGSFIHNTYLPTLGYFPNVELADDDERRKRGLSPKPRMADLHDPAQRQRNYISVDGDWINLSASVCTAPDQIAFIPGYRRSPTLEAPAPSGNLRACYAFESEAKILNFFSVLSARYATRRDHWKDVAIEIDYQPGHEYNLARMIQSVKDSLEYFTKNFSPYQHRQLRIIEFPRYQLFAQAFPNTIPYSEGVGFIAKVDPNDEDDIDYPYYVTAHEVAHQWWAHQIIGANVQGATLLSESLAQYSALMVMKARFGASQMKRFLRHELDNYLTGRATERKKEMPLVRVENQPYIHYSKASLVFYALAEAIGEDAVNRALHALLGKYAFRGPPYPTSTDLIAELLQVTPASERSLIADLFMTITLYENRAIEATSRALPGGQHEVTVRVAARKLRADELGVETEIPLDEEVDVGVLGEDGKPLWLERRRLRTGETSLILRVTAPPRKAGIDPLNKLIDRKPDDNVTNVEPVTPSPAPSPAPAR